MMLTNDVDWGLKVWDDGEQKKVPKHANRKQLVQSFLQRVPGAFPRRLTQKLLIKHFLGEQTVYFTGARGDWTLVMLDIDCHKSGSPEGARKFAEYLKNRFFQNLYFEPSTNGNGIHGYVMVDKSAWTAADHNAAMKSLEVWLKCVLAGTKFDVETVEVKGRCPVVVWEKDLRGFVKQFTMGGLAKMPRDASRADEWATTTRMTVDELKKLPERFPVIESTPKVKEHVKQQAKAASVRGNAIDKERFEAYRPLARKFLPEPVQVGARVRATAEDVDIFLVLLEFFGENPNPDGSMPWARFRGLWRKLYRDGDVERNFDNKRFAFIRNLVSDKGGIEWIDANYSIGLEKGKGQAAKWKASEQLLKLMEGYREVGTKVGAEKCGRGSVTLTQYNNLHLKVSGSESSELDALWLKMPLENGKNVGLRPVMTFSCPRKWRLEDHLPELEAMGLAWMAV
jgi:hypothetical protein